MRRLSFLLLIFSADLFAVEVLSESEFAYVRSGGNSDVQTTNAKTTTEFRWERDQYKFGGRYLYGESDDSVSGRNWDVLNKYERELTKRLSLTTAELIEGNRFIGIKARYNSDLGIKYYHIKTDQKRVFTEISFRYSIEDRYAPEENAYYNRGRLYNELDHIVSKNFRYKIWIEYVPNFTETDDHLFNAEASITSTLTDIFSLKVSYFGTFDTRPVTEDLQSYDYNFTTALVMKY